jgi:hypothetical protein
MAEKDVKANNAPDVEDVFSVGSRVSWSAIFAGGLLALALQFLFTLLGSAVGLSISGRVSPGRLENMAVIWALFTLCLSLFVGGVVVSQLTVGENKVEAMLYGIIMWGFLLSLILGLGAVGVSSGFNSLVATATMAESAATQDWEKGAREAGVLATEIEALRQKVAQRQQEQRQQRDPSRDPATPDTNADLADARRITWYVFLGTWLSMMAAAGGSLLGAGPTFRLVLLRNVPELRT